MTTLIRKLEFEDFQLKITYESPVWTIDIDNAYRVQNMHDKTIKITIIDKPEHHWSMTVYGVEDTFAEILKLGL